MYGDHALPRLDKDRQFFHDGALTPVIHPGKRLIQKEQIRILYQRARQKDALFLSAREFGNLPLFKIRESQFFQRLFDAFLFRLAGLSKPAERKEETHLCDTLHGNRKIPVHLCALRHVGDTRPDLFKRLPENLHRSAFRFQKAEHGL